ncbi:MAG: SDR family oxidoreductase [Alphaproteobacteria bacterium]|nr:SDR family oxidoreductase [Alphaproteobacteria bacterium]
MKLELEGRTALVCGASQGLGYAIAEGLAAEGVRVGLFARNGAKLAERAKALEARGLKAMALAGDLGDFASVEKALASFGSVDILVCNTGGPPAGKPDHVDPDLWRSQFEAMVLNQMRLVSLCLPSMRARKFGRIVNVASTSVVEPIGYLPLSGPLRAALANWLKALSDAVARDGITVNTLLTGSFSTERIDKLNATAAAARGVAVEAIVAETSAAIPAGRYGSPEEFADVAVFLASARASYVTGQMIGIDGGAMRSM